MSRFASGLDSGGRAPASWKAASKAMMVPTRFGEARPPLCFSSRLVDALSCADGGSVLLALLTVLPQARAGGLMDRNASPSEAGNGSATSSMVQGITIKTKTELELTESLFASLANPRGPGSGYL